MAHPARLAMHREHVHEPLPLGRPPRAPIPVGALVIVASDAACTHTTVRARVLVGAAAETGWREIGLIGASRRGVGLWPLLPEPNARHAAQWRRQARRGDDAHLLDANGRGWEIKVVEVGAGGSR